MKALTVHCAEHTVASHTVSRSPVPWLYELFHFICDAQTMICICVFSKARDFGVSLKGSDHFQDERSR